ncbi:hypothetical protein F8568_043870 [Actinomadura sp. LD22]|uniref:DUF6801 domain-containing protein n=1 Tax=Actinomadura physcomitrii TaxID=2650748 RepID=A0A6I4MMX4_9ACTN|nr:DUF6801 domain-containing protein [Actinomadura physcomitrii]MWA07162.1 hypothetical protein [Actinomadura physcomitrii]
MSVRARRAGRLTAAAAAGALLAAGLSGAGAAAAGTQNADLTVAYQCAFPAGPQEVSVRYRAAFPASAAPGGRVRPGKVTATLTVPRAALADLGATEVGGTVQVAARTEQNGAGAKAAWPAFTVEPAAVPDDGDVTLTASGRPADMTAARTGTLTVTVGALDLGLAPEPAAGGAEESPVACTPAQGQAGVLAAVPIAADGAAQPPKRTAAVPAGEAPPDCQDLKEPGWLISGCVYMNGYANVRKLAGATVLNDPAGPAPALTNVEYNIVPNLPTGTGTDVRFRFHEPLRSKAGFLTFGFMPTTATMEMDQVGLGTETSEPYEKGQTRQHVQARMRVTIRLYDVKVNGTPLDVGPHCESSRPADIALGDAPGAGITNIVKGGTLDGSFEIPPFRGCGSGEDLDPLFTGAVSGPGNYVKVSQGTICGRAAATCPPAMPELKR